MEKRDVSAALRFGEAVLLEYALSEKYKLLDLRDKDFISIDDLQAEIFKTGEQRKFEYLILSYKQNNLLLTLYFDKDRYSKSIASTLKVNIYLGFPIIVIDRNAPINEVYPKIDRYIIDSKIARSIYKLKNAVHYR